ncbi:MAG: hypothetical protein Q8O46_04215 [bacterium]|nr:hypothetical protein [bacterium]
MNKIKMFTKLSMVGFIVLASIFANANFASADYAVAACDSATLNGAVNPNGAPTTVWFEWGPNPSPSYSTPKQTFTSSGTFSQKITGLTENTTYYFRAVAQNSFGTAYGSTISFTTPACPVIPPPPPPVPAPTVNISADQTNISYNSATTVRWYSNSANSCSGSGGANGWSGNKALVDNFYTGNLTNTTTFYITCINSTGTGNGSVTISVGNPPPPPPPPPAQNPPTVNLQINGSHGPVSLNSGGTAQVTWTAQPLNSASLSCTGSGGMGIWPGGKPLTGLAIFFPTQSMTFVITCTDRITNLSATDSVTVNINTTSPPPPPLVTSGIISPSYVSCIIYSGQNSCQVNLSWSTTNPVGTSTVTKSPNNTTVAIGNSGSNSFAVIFPGATFYLYNNFQLLDQSNATTTCTSGTNWNGNVCQTSTATTCQDPNALNYGGLLPCQYPTPVCQDPSAINYRGPLPCQYPSPVCQDPSAINYKGALPCRYQTSQPQPSVTISADDTSIDEDDSTTVRWSSNNATSCSGSGGDNGWSGNKSLSGSFFTGSLNSDKTFHITCSNSQGGSDSDSVTIDVDQNGGSSGNVQVDISADDTSIDEGDSTRIRWDSDNADDCEARGGTNSWSGRNIGTSGSFTTGDLDEDETFRIECTNDDGDSDTDSVTIRVDGNNNNNNNDRPNVTISADRTNVNYNQGTTVRWDADDADECFASGGTNGWSGRRSSSGGNFSTGALFSTVTFFIDCENDEGNESDSVTVRVDSFIQPQQPQTIFVPSPTPAPIIRNTTIVQNTGTTRQLVTLSIDGGDDFISPDESRIYHVEWKNISNQTLRKVALRINLPDSLTVENTNRGSYTASNNTITLDIDTLSPEETGELLFTGKTKSSLKENELVVVVANIVYTDRSDTQGEVVAYATHHGDLGGRSVLGANVFDAGFLPSTLLGWIFFLLLVLLLVWLAKYLYGQSTARPSTVMFDGGHS